MFDKIVSENSDVSQENITPAIAEGVVAQSVNTQPEVVPSHAQPTNLSQESSASTAEVGQTGVTPGLNTEESDSDQQDRVISEMPTLPNHHNDNITAEHPAGLPQSEITPTNPDQIQSSTAEDQQTERVDKSTEKSELAQRLVKDAMGEKDALSAEIQTLTVQKNKIDEKIAAIGEQMNQLDGVIMNLNNPDIDQVLNFYQKHQNTSEDHTSQTQTQDQAVSTSRDATTSPDL